MENSLRLKDRQTGLQVKEDSLVLNGQGGGQSERLRLINTYIDIYVFDITE